jgi:hypothetical protein
MSEQDREADTTDAGRGRDVGQGLPEEQPGGASSEGEGSASKGTGEAGDRSPDTSSDSESDPGKATGNPDAAG